MAVINKFLGLSIVYFTLFMSFVCSEDVCVKRTSCMCVFPNGTGVDLTPATGTGFYSAPYYVVQQNASGIQEYKLFTYYYHPCLDIPTNRTNSPGDTCDVPLTLYRLYTTMQRDNITGNKFTLKETACNFLGKSTEIHFGSNGRSITYINGPSDTEVLLSCAQGDIKGDNRLQVTSMDDPANLTLTFYSSHACLKQIDEPSRSFGSTLLIIFFSFVVFYLVLGVCTKKFLMGATGIEVIPNLAFWTDLPNLVKDGWAFAINGFKLPSRGVGPTASPDPNSYDSI